MSFRAEGTSPLGARILAVMQQSRRRRAMQAIADNEHLLVTAETIEPPRLASRPSVIRMRDASRPTAAASPGALLATIAVVLIAMHAICAALIIDRALAHARATISQGD
jgi:hypothetical protein